MRGDEWILCEVGGDYARYGSVKVCEEMGEGGMRGAKRRGSVGGVKWK